MAYKFHYQNNLTQESRGEDFNYSKVPISFKDSLNNLVINARNITMVGWRFDTGTYVINSMINDNKKVHLVEIFKQNCQLLDRQIKSDSLVIHNIDVREFNDHIPMNERDLLIWQDGPEHLHMNSSFDLINQMKNTFKSIIIATPKGAYEQGSLYGNDAECHLSSWEIEDYSRLGFIGNIISDNFLIGYWTNENIKHL